MKKLFFVFFFVLLNFNIANAQNNDKDVKELFKVVYKIMSAERQFGKPIENSDIALDYAVEILQKKPESLEAYYSLVYFFETYMKINKTAMQKCVIWLDENFDDIDNPNIDTAKKIIYTTTLSKNTTFYERFKNNYPYAIRNYILLKIKRECTNKNYQALAMLELDYKSCLNEFLEKFPYHTAIPLAKLKIAEKDMLNKKYKTCINETTKLYEQYKNIELPMGYKYEIECFILLAKAYNKTRDFNNVKKYLLLIKEKAPQRYLIDNLEDNLKFAIKMISK